MEIIVDQNQKKYRTIKNVVYFINSARSYV